ncbi:MAG: Phosphoesterase [Pedosphaera sp.]|nr:Phosphoesterase [Pedosphaera sp.]
MTEVGVTATKNRPQNRKNRSFFVGFTSILWTCRIPCWPVRGAWISLRLRMDILPKPEVILTHESDLDGLVAGVLLQRLAKKLFAADIPLEAYHYNNWKQRELRERSAWVTDLNFEARLDKPEWVVIDHHATEAPAKSARLIHDLGKSAGLLCYELCKENGLGSPQLDRLVHLNNVADLFLEDDPDFILANDYANLVKVYQFWNLHTLVEGELERLLDHSLLEVMSVKRRVENPLGFAWSKENVSRITPTVGYVETILGNNNLIVHQMLEEKATPYPVLLTLFRRTNGVIIVSLRSRGGEALKVAEKLQGGGHANACGATLPRAIKNIPDALDYLREVLNPKTEAPLNNLESLFDSITPSTSK